MVAQQHGNLVRVSLTLDPIDVDLLDRLGALENQNRSAEIRGILQQFRPMLRATVEAFEAAHRQRHNLDEAMAKASIAQLEAVLPEAQRMQDAYLGAMARIEGAMTAHEASDPRPSNHGGQNPQPPSPPATPGAGSRDENDA